VRSAHSAVIFLFVRENMARDYAPSITRRLITVLFVGQGLARIALFTTTAIGSISGVQLAGTERVAGWPSTVQLLGGTIAAYVAGRVMNRYGRRVGLALGFIAGMAGGLICLTAASFCLFISRVTHCHIRDALRPASAGAADGSLVQ
jgi:MFS family permease